MADARAQEFDIVVIGAGVAGSLIAWRLGQAGLKIALVEAGEPLGDRAQFVASFGASQNKSLGSPYPSAPSGPEQPGPANSYYDQADVPGYLSTYERLAGGTTWHWLGHTPRLLPNDFRMRTTYGVGVDWPIGYADLEPWYCHGEWQLGVAGDDQEWANIHGALRSRPFPMPQIWPTWSDHYVRQRLDGLSVDGQDIRVLSTPAARNSQAYDGRPPCAGNASCIPICPIGAKYDGSVHVRKAAETGNVELISNAVVTKLELDERRRIRSACYLRPGQPAESIGGKIFVLAANAIESAKLLLLSAAEGAPDGLANTSGQVGRNLMDHIQKSVFVRTADPVYPFRGPPSTSGIETFRDGAFRAERSAMRFSLNNDGWFRRSPASPTADVQDAVGKGVFGLKLKAAIFDAVSRQFRLSLSTEVPPEPENRVTLSDKLDSDGVRRPRLSFSVPAYTKDAFEPAVRVILRLVEAMGAEAVDLDAARDPGKYSGAGHVMGTCRMGTDPKNAVVNADCQAFDHPNLYIAGAGLLPTCGTANPTLTVAALALRAADQIARAEFGKNLAPLPS